MSTVFTARIERDRHTKDARLEIATEDAWTLYSGATPGTVNLEAPLLSGQGGGSYPLPADRLSRSYFLLESGGKRLFLAETRLPMAGGWNFRDLGGIPAGNGRYVAWGRLFRADDLQGLTREDDAYLSSIPIVTVVDFRTDHEVSMGPDILPASARFSHHCPMEPGNIDRGLLRRNPTWTQEEEIMKAVYRELVTDTAIIALYREFFGYVQEERCLPLLFHCAAGKDRTGMAAALILLALGVSESSVMADYTLSARFLKGKYPETSALFTVQPGYLEAALERMRDAYGSPEAYLAGHLDVDLERMRALFLAEA